MIHERAPDGMRLLLVQTATARLARLLHVDNLEGTCGNYSGRYNVWVHTVVWFIHVVMGIKMVAILLRSISSLCVIYAAS
jgi:hypothetical protein